MTLMKLLPFTSTTKNTRLKRFLEAFHTLKESGFGSFKISKIVEEIHLLETFLNNVGKNWSVINKEKLHSLLNKMNLTRNLFLKENRKFLELANASINKENGGDMNLLIKRIQSAIVSFNNDFILKEVSTLFNQFISPTKELAIQQDKLVDIKIQESDIYLDPKNYKNLFKSLLHIFRNSVDHGIESREERVAKNKNESAHLEVSFFKGIKTFTINIKDDGKGIELRKSIKLQKRNLKLRSYRERKLSLLFLNLVFLQKTKPILFREEVLV